MIHFDTSPGAPWWALPWPNDATWGRPLRGLFPHPLVRRFERLALAHGPSPSGAAFFAFASSPPSIHAEIRDLETGAPFPAETRWFPTTGRYHPAGLLAVMAVPGWVMRPGVAHAVVVRVPGGEPPPRLREALTGRGDGALAAAYAPLRSGPVSLQDVVAATVFTPADQSAPLRRLVAAALEYRGKLAGETTVRPGPGGVRFHEGRWRAPQFRAGFGWNLLRKGETVLDARRSEPVPFGLALPPGEAPPRGWPLVLSLHGGGCTYTERLNEVVSAAAPHGLAVAQQTLPYNRGRPGGGRLIGDLNFFNVANPASSVGIFHQAVVEQMIFLRLLLDGWPLDPERVFLIGHSNGGTTAAMVLAVEPLVRAGVVAGFGGHVGTYVEESDVIGEAMNRLWPAITLRPAAAEPRSRFHPVVNLVHTAWGVWDTVNFAPYWQRGPLPGVGPKHVFLAQGMHDKYASVRGQTAVVGAAGLDVAGDGVDTAEADYAHRVLALRRRPRLGYPVSDNVSRGDGTRRTGVAVERAAIGDGHEVCFEDKAILAQWVGAFASLAHTGRMVVDAPG